MHTCASMETLYSLIRMKGYLLVKCHHTATNWHVHRYLSWHAANNEHFFSCVRMECWFIHLFSSPHLFICCSYWFISMSVGEKKNNHTATVEYTSSKCNSSPQTLTSLLLPGGLFLKSPGTSLGLESCFMFSMFTSKINILIDLKMIKQNY